MEYSYPLFLAFVKAEERAYRRVLGDQTWSAFVGDKADGDKLQEVLDNLKE